MARRDRGLPPQVELQTVHPVHDQMLHPPQPRVERKHLGRPQLHRALHRHRTDEPVRLHRAGAPGRIPHPCRGEPAAVDVDGLDRAAHPELDAQPPQSSDPRIDPCLVGRCVEQAIRLAVVAPTHDVHEERLAHIGDRAAAGEFLLRGNQRTGEALREHLLVLSRLALCPHEVPPRHVLPLPEPPRGAAGEENPEPLDELPELGGRDAGAEIQCGDQRLTQRLRVEHDRIDPAGHRRIRTASARKPRLRGAHEVVPHTVGIAREGDAAHRVRHVVIEAGEEPEAVLARQRPPAALPGPGHRDAPALTAERFALVDGDLEAALRQFVRGSEPGHPTPEHGHSTPRPAGQRGGGGRLGDTQVGARHDRGGTGDTQQASPGKAPRSLQPALTGHCRSSRRLTPTCQIAGRCVRARPSA